VHESGKPRAPTSKSEEERRETLCGLELGRIGNGNTTSLFVDILVILGILSLIMPGSMPLFAALTASKHDDARWDHGIVCS